MGKLRWSVPKSPLWVVAVLGIGAGVPCAGQDAGGVGGAIRVDPLHGKARIEGRVVNAKGDRAASAQVRVYGWADVLVANGSYEFGWAALPPKPRATTTTDATGFFAVEDLARGMNVVVVETKDGERGAGIATAIEERPGVLPFKTSASPAVLRGVVLDEDAAPLPGAPVVAAPANVIPAGEASMLALFALTTRTVSDAAGRFEVRAATEDVLVAAMRPRDGRWTTRRRQQDSAAENAPIRLAFAGGKALSGRVEGAMSGRAVAGARVTVVSCADPLTKACTILTTEADRNGALLVSSFPPLGIGGFAVLAPGIGGDWQDWREPFDGRLQVRRGATITGHVRTAAGSPVVGALVVAHAFSWPALSTTTDETGAYAIEGLPRTRPWMGDVSHEGNGGVFAWVEAPGYAADPGVEMLLVAPDTATVTRDFTLREGVTIRGRCDPTDAGHGLHWAPKIGPYVTLLFVRGTAVAEDGSFVLTDLPPGRVELGLSEDRPVVVDGLHAGESRGGVVIPPTK